MQETLCDRLISAKSEIEAINKELEEADLDTRVPESKISRRQMEIMQEYEWENEVFHNARMGDKSIEETLEDVSEINQGWSRYLPRRVDEEHNKIVSELGDLIRPVTQYDTKGITTFDNFITAAVGTIGCAALVGWGGYELASYTPDPEFTRQFAPAMAKALGPFISIGFGIRSHMDFRANNPPIEQARYLDNKIEEFYH